ncbi:hypothetical protein [Alysiella filiformis]|uniref:Ribbon-helix-helix protein, copG family n=1 Tax=Alysiella filiformis DSM 16848 TaxID=1120981 RepID=A0A286EAT3_9NEIS|nr:hypothetical protein [Alysiella filiformis]QMT32260.1 hypothetical protein H3L97_05365 [Alysiella filiformis]UBQ56819.1 hypothetical protein JF568_03320 [Alysiella filiformis DSM 16848]SOD68013.1 hypothetical protein SAMN02746062_01089 [Alysiella filiformis DSM 16848]
MSNVYYTFQLDNHLKQAFFQAAKQSNRSNAELLREFMQDFVQKQTIAKQKISLAEKLSTYPHQAADVDFEFEREK